MLHKFGGENVFQGRIIEVHIGTLTADQAFTFTDWSAEMKAKASICISEDDTLIESLEIAKGRIQIMIDKGMDNAHQVLKGLIDKANKRIAGIKSGEKPALRPDANAKYYAEVEIDLDTINEPMIADPDVNNKDVSKRYTHDTIRPLSFYGGTKKVFGLYKERPINIFLSDEDSFGACLYQTTGPAIYNIRKRAKVKKLGYKLNEYGLFNAETGEKLAGKTEQSIFEFLNWNYKEPNIRK